MAARLRPRVRLVERIERRRQLRRRRQQLVAAGEGVGDREQLAHVVREVDLLEHRHHAVLAGHGLDDGERAEVRRAEHDEPPARDLLRVVDAVPELRVPADQVARDQAAHRVGDQVHRLAGKPFEDETSETVGGLVDVLAPVVGVPDRLPARAQRQDGAGVVALVRPRRDHAIPAVRLGLAVRSEGESLDVAPHEPQHVDPDVVPVGARNGGEIGARDAVQEDDVAERRGSRPRQPRPRGEAAQHLELGGVEALELLLDGGAALAADGALGQRFLEAVPVDCRAARFVGCLAHEIRPRARLLLNSNAVEDRRSVPIVLACSVRQYHPIR